MTGMNAGGAGGVGGSGVTPPPGAGDAPPPGASDAPPPGAGDAPPPGASDAPPPRRAIVVGTGFGGAVTACRLAQAGFEVELLERGRRYALSDFPALPRTGELWPDARRWTWPGSHGLWDMRNLDGLSIAQAAGYGGGSLVYANVHLRPPQSVFEKGWPADCTNRTGLDDYFDLVGYTLDVKPVPAAWRNTGKTGVMTAAFQAATNGKPENVFFPPLAIKFPAAPPATAAAPLPPTPEEELRPNRHGQPQGECQRCGACDFGCRYGAKNTLDRNYLAMAEATGRVNVRTLTEVLLVSSLGKKGYRVHYNDHLLDRPGTLEAPYLFLCGGSVNTTELLLRSIKNGLPFKAPRPSSDDPFPGQRYFFNADALAMIFSAEKETFPSGGPVITTALVHEREDCHIRAHADAPGRKWFLIEDGGYPAAMENLFSFFRTPLLLGRNRFDPSKAPPTALTAIGPPFDAGVPDRYPAFLGGLLAALRDGTLPDLLPPTFKAATAQMKGLAAQLRDDEVGELSMAIRDALFVKSLLFKWLKVLRFDRLCPPLWRLLFRVFVWLTKVDPKNLLETTLEVTHHRYGVDKLKQFPERVLHAAMGERYPVNAPENPFGRKLPKPPPPDGGRRALLLAMGRDDLPATLKLDETGRLVAEFSDASFPTLSEEERVMRGIADALGGTLRTSPLWSFARRPVSAHSHGGCTLGKVTNDHGQVNDNTNLFINDGSLLPTPVGVNPSGTIAALAERNIAHFVCKLLGLQEPPWQDEIKLAKKWADDSKADGVMLEPPRAKSVKLSHDPIGFSFRENMAGHLQLTDSSDASRLPDPRTRRVPLAPFLSAEHKARRGGRASFELHARVQDIGSFLNDREHPIPLAGTLSLPMPPSGQPVTVTISSGTMNLLTDASPDRRIMKYTLAFSALGKDWTLLGIKEIQDDPGFDAWLDTSALYAELHEEKDAAFAEGKASVRARGILRLGIKNFLDDQLKGMAAEGTADPARVIWTLGSFAVFFFGELQGIYAPEIERFRHLFGSGWRALPATVKKATPRTAHLLRGL